MALDYVEYNPLISILKNYRKHLPTRKKFNLLLHSFNVMLSVGTKRLKRVNIIRTEDGDNR